MVIAYWGFLLEMVRHQDPLAKTIRPYLKPRLVRRERVIPAQPRCSFVVGCRVGRILITIIKHDLQHP